MSTGYHADLRCVCGDALIELHDGSLICDECHRRYVRTDSVVISGNNPRQYFDDGQLQEMCDSIREHGILEALVFRPCPNSVRHGMFELVLGERRFRSSCILELKIVPADIRDLTDEQVADIMLVENMQRVDLQPLEEAAAIQRRLDRGGITQGDLAAKLGKSQSWIANRLRLLQAPEDLQKMIISREITPKHVLAVLPYSKYPVFDEIVSDLKEDISDGDKVSVRQLEDSIESIVSRRYGNESCLNLDDPPYDYRAYSKLFDLSKCEGCDHIVTFPDEDDDENVPDRFCLNRRCWKDVVNRAKQQCEENRVKNLESVDVIDTKDLVWGTYEYLKYADFDKSGCAGCEHCRLTKNDSEICIDPACFKKKKSAHSREVNSAKRAEEQRVWDAVDMWVDHKDGLDDDDVKRLLWPLLFNVPTDVAKKALEPWGKFKSFYRDDVDKIIGLIPDGEHYAALMRIFVGRMALFHNGMVLESLQKIVPAAAEYYQPAETEAVT